MGSWVDVATVILSSAAVSAALSCALVWLARTWIGERLRSAIQAEYAAKLETLKVQMKAEADTQLESHKVKLKARGDVELEKLRAALAISAAVQSTKYGGAGATPLRRDRSYTWTIAPVPSGCTAISSGHRILGRTEQRGIALVWWRTPLKRSMLRIFCRGYS